MKIQTHLVGVDVRRLTVRHTGEIRAPRRLLPATRARERGITLIDCLVYIGLSVLLLGAAALAFSRCLDNTKGLRRNVDDITRTLHVGEVWRMDIRAATGAIEAELNEQTIHIPTKNSQVSYRFADSQVWRKANPGAEWTAVMPRVKASSMQSDNRSQVKVWRWELELEAVKKNARVRPLFTFLAVPAAQSKP